MLAEVTGVDVSVTGLIFGAIFGVIVYVIFEALAKETGRAWLRPVGILLGLAIFIAAGFNIYEA